MESTRPPLSRARPPMARVSEASERTDPVSEAEGGTMHVEGDVASSPRPKRVVVVRTRPKKEEAAERLHVVRVRGDGKCLFRALAIGLAAEKGMALAPQREDVEADQLRLAVADAMCRTHDRRSQFPEALEAIEAEDTLPRYCKRLVSEEEAFWGGEPEMLVLSRMLNKPIAVYVPATQAGRLGRKGRSPYVPIQVYGGEYRYRKNGTERGVLRLLFNGTDHYDLLVGQ